MGSNEAVSLFLSPTHTHHIIYIKNLCGTASRCQPPSSLFHLPHFAFFFTAFAFDFIYLYLSEIVVYGMSRSSSATLHTRIVVFI